MALWKRERVWWSARGLLSLVPAHSLEEASIAITVGLLGPQDVSGFEGLAVLLLSSCNVILYRAGEGIMRSLSLGGEKTPPQPPAVLWPSPAPGNYSGLNGTTAPAQMGSGNYHLFVQVVRGGAGLGRGGHLAPQASEEGLGGEGTRTVQMSCRLVEWLCPLCQGQRWGREPEGSLSHALVLSAQQPGREGATPPTAE